MATKKKNDTVYSPDGTEKSIFAALKKITKTDCEAYFILWKYAPELLPNYENIHSFEDLTNTYKQFMGRTLQSCEKMLYKEDVQAGIKYLLKRLDGKRDIELLNKYYELSMAGDVQALKAYMDFKKNFFTDDETDELKSILDGASSDIADDDDFEMQF